MTWSRNIARALNTGENDNVVRLVMIEGAGERAFCAGGDVQLLYHAGRSNPAAGRQFWFDEYRLNARIHRYPKPFVALMDGIVMGGGVGVSAHGCHRIVYKEPSLLCPRPGSVSCPMGKSAAPGGCHQVGRDCM